MASTSIVLPATGGGTDTTLGAKYVYTTRFEIISSGTSGSVTLPTVSEVVLDDFGGATDAVISQAASAKPSLQSAYTAGGVVVATSFDSTGAWVLTGTPSAYPVAIIYRVRQTLSNFDSTSINIMGVGTVFSSPVTSVNTRTGAITLTASDVGLGNVTNTSDANKPVSTAQQAALDLKAPLTDVQIFSASGTWTKSTGAKVVRIWGVGAGGGGGSGRKGAATTVRCGGGGGAGGLLGWAEFQASDLGATEAVTIGQGGAGGLAVTANSTNGNTGTAGGDTTLGSKAIFVGGNAGAGGTSTTGTGGASKSAQNYANTWAQSPGAAASTTGLSGAQPANQGQMPNGGASGGGVSSADVAAAGSAGGNITGVSPYTALITGSANGGAGATSATTNGTDGPSYSFMYGLGLGTGGGSSRANITGSPGRGGNGGNGGGGGGGGGAALDTTSPQSGAGGSGGNGWLVVITYF